MGEPLKLKVMEALQEEAYKGIVRVDSQTMKDLDVRPGDILEIIGNKTTVGIVDRAYPTDVGQPVIRMDGVMRRNAKTGIGELVIVKKADVKEAKKVVIAPAQPGVILHVEPISRFKVGLLGRPVITGDQVALGGASRRKRSFEGSPFEDIFDIFENGSSLGFGLSGLKLIVASTTPKGPVIITENTELAINPQTVEVSEERVIEVTYEDIGGLEEEVKKIREMVELPLKHPEIFERLGVQPPKGVLLHGPPGTGKTLLAKAVANETNAHFIHLDAPSVMCVGGKTEILTNPEGRKTISEIFDEAMQEGEIILRDSKKTIVRPKKEIKLYSMDDEMNIVKDTVKSILKIDADETYSIKTKKRGDFTTSKNQPFATLDSEGTIVWKKAEELIEGDLIAIAGQINSNKEDPIINWKSKLDKNFYADVQGKVVSLSEVKDIDEITSLRYTTLKKNVNTTKEILPIFNLIPEFMEFIGAIYSDGWLSEDSVGIADEKSEFRNRYKELFKICFGISDERIAESTKKGNAKVVVYSTVLSRFLEQGFDVVRGKKPLDVKLPKWIFSCSKESIAAFLRGYFQGDGCEGWANSVYPTPVFYSKNQEFLKDIQFLLLHLGIISKIEYHTNDFGDMWKVVLLDTESREKFYEFIVKDLKIDLGKKCVRERIKEGSCEKIPNISPLLKRLKTNLNITYGKHINENLSERYISGRDNLSFRKARYLLNAFRKVYLDSKIFSKEIESDLHLLDNISSGRIKWDVITKVIKQGKQVLYDFTMNKYGNFLGGNPLTVLHNSKFVGEAEKKIRELFDEAQKNSPSIVFIDEIDAIATKREESYGEVEKRVVAQLLATMDGLKARGRVVVIAATNRPNALDPALRRPGRFDREVEIGVPKEEGRLKIIKIHTRNMPLDKEVKLEDFAKVTHGFVGADLEALCKEAAMVRLRKLLPDLQYKKEEPIPKELLEKLIIDVTDFREALKMVRPSAMREVFVEAPNVTWQDVGGLEGIKQELIEAVEWPLKYPERFTRMGVRPPRGILMYGPPGTGKTLLAKAIAKESEANFILVNGPEVLSKWLGESLPYDEELFVKKKGKILRMKIGEIVENKEEVEVLSFDTDLRVNFSRITDYIKHKQTSKLLEVTTRTGRKIKVTSDHSLFSFINGEFRDIPASHLIESESYIAIPKRINLPSEKVESINLYPFFKEDSSVFVTDIVEYLIKAKAILGLDKAAKLLNVSKKYFADILCKNLPVSIVTFDRLITEVGLSLDFNKIKIKLKGSVHKYSLLFDLSPDFWKLVGLWIAEGDLNGYMVRLHNSNYEIRQNLERACKKLGYTISSFDKNFSINSLFLQKLFKSVLGLVSGAKNKRIPSMIYGLDREAKANLLRGYFSGDGSIPKQNNGKYYIEAGTISKELANDLLYLLLDFGIVASMRVKKEITDNDSYRVYIFGVKNFERFKEIGFIDSARNNKISEYITSRKWFRSDLIPLSGELYNLASSNLNVGACIGKERLKQLLSTVDIQKTNYKSYWDLIEGDIFFDLVVSIRELDSEEYVYDVEIPQGHNFLAGFGGIFAHNSEKAIRKIFEKARQASPTIIFFDEIDSIAPRRGREGDSHATERVVNQLLTEIDGLQQLNDVVVIAATNRPDIIDPALLRPGRFDRIVFTPLPEEAARLEILKIHTKSMPLDKDVKIDILANKMKNYVGSDIEAVCREAAMLALRKDGAVDKVKNRDFLEAMKKVKASITDEDIKKYEQVEDEYLRTARGAAMRRDNSMNYLG